MANEIEKGVKKKTVYATEANKHHKTGMKIELREEMADHLVNKGFAAETEKEALATTPKEGKGPKEGKV